jgi:2,4-dienoyl-CoA reductase-like NADH-dependent reductase (Old Yellow Enzyme family)
LALKHVFTPIKLGSLEVKNRIARTAHSSSWVVNDEITDGFIAYHAERAKGGCGLSILEAASVHATNRMHLSILDDRIIPGYQRLMAAVRPTGMRVLQQLWYGGNVSTGDGGRPAWTVSSLPGYLGSVGEPMGIEQIQELVQAFVQAAVRCQKGGLDGIEIHAAHGYIFHQFLWPAYNTRTDAYGGSLENRMRFLLETLRAIRAAVGPQFCVGVRMGASDAPGGVDEETAIAAMLAVQAEGLIDYVNASYGDYFRMDTMVSAMHSPTGYELPSASQLTAQATVPRLVAGRFRTLDEAEQVIRDGVADMVSLVRAQIADPALVRKTQEGRPDLVRPCIACNQGCWGGMARTKKLGCTVNPAVAREAELSEDLITVTDAPKKVLVVGGGPAGLEAARIAALRGHTVTLAEASSALGGAAAVARKAPRMHTIGDALYWLEQEVFRLGVDVRLGAYMEVDDVLAEQADVVIVATGSMPRMDGFQLNDPAERARGVQQPHVLSSTDLLTGDRPVGRSALVLDTVGHIEVLGVVEHLLSLGAAVTLVTPLIGFAPFAESTHRTQPALERYYRMGDFELLVRHQLIEVRGDDCLVRPCEGGANQVRAIPAETVILITQNEPLRDLYDELVSAGVTARLVGDARSPRDMQMAITEGHLAARAL